MSKTASDPQAGVPLFSKGDAVRVRKAYPIGHCRTPFYFRGAVGSIERHCGRFANPEELAYGRSGLPKVSLYRVRTRMADLWADYDGPAQDMVEVEVFEHWLEPVGQDGIQSQELKDE